MLCFCWIVRFDATSEWRFIDLVIFDISGWMNNPRQVQTWGLRLSHLLGFVGIPRLSPGNVFWVVDFWKLRMIELLKNKDLGNLDFEK